MLEIRFLSEYRHHSGIIYRDVWVLFEDNRPVLVNPSEEYLTAIRKVCWASEDLLVESPDIPSEDV